MKNILLSFAAMTILLSSGSQAFAQTKAKQVKNKKAHTNVNFVLNGEGLNANNMEAFKKYFTIVDGMIYATVSNKPATIKVKSNDGSYATTLDIAPNNSMLALARTGDAKTIDIRF